MRALILAVGVGVAAAGPARAQPHLLSIDRFSMRPAGSEAAVSVSLWQIPADAGPIQLDTTVSIGPGLRRPGQPLGFYIAALASHEVWWDGVLIGRGGVVGRSPAEEIPGPVEAHYQIPDRLAGPGPHTLRIHTSSFHRHFAPGAGYWGVVVGDYEAIVTWRRAEALSSTIALSGLALMAGFAFALFAVLRDRASLLLALLALTAAALLVTEVWRPLVGYTYDLHIVRLVAIVALSWLVAVLLVALVASRFPYRGGRWLPAVVALAGGVAVGLAAGWDAKALVMHVLGFGTALLWVALATARRAPGSAPALVGLGATCGLLALGPFQFLDRLFLALDFLFLCLLVSHALELRRVRQARARAELDAARLQLEMVRRQIQPHFLMNSLTALAEWVETDPPTAVRMIEAIAEELRLLGELSQQPIVRAEDELRLCRSHLATMSLRKDVSYELTVEGVGGDELLPPAVLHTLVENAVTHGTAAPRVTLRLTGVLEGARRRLILESPASPDAHVDAAGTGTRYVEARLRQAWGDDWSFRQGAVGETWRAELTMPAGAAG